MAEPSPDYVDLGKASIHGCSTSESHQYMLTLSRPLYNTRPSIMSYRSLGVDVRHLWGLCCITYLYGNNHRGCHLSDILLKKNYGWGGGGMELRSFIGVGPGHPLVHARHWSEKGYGLATGKLQLKLLTRLWLKCKHLVSISGFSTNT